jgi:hypothetical protein
VPDALSAWKPIFRQPLVPFLICFVAEGLRVLFEHRKRWVVALAVIAPILMVRDIRIIPSEYSNERFLPIPEYRQVARIIEANSPPRGRVISFRPGYIFESGRQYFLGSENQYAIDVGSSPQVRAKYHLVSSDELLPAMKRARLTSSF